MTVSSGGVVITGGSGGIGRGLVARLAADGLAVLNLDRAAPAEPVAGETWIEVDLADAAAVGEVMARVAADHAPTRLVNNAGTARPDSFANTTAADLDRAMAVNLRAGMLAAQAMLPAMRAAGGGRIVNISSRASLGKEDRSAYSASKAAIHGLSRTMALELGADGITVNVVAPGPIATPAFERINAPGTAGRTRIEAGVPLRRLGSPADIAAAVAFFLGGEAGFVTGQVLYVCGGLSVGIAR